MSWGAFKAALVGIAAGGAVTCAITLTAPGANAKSTYESPYGYDRTWNAAVRLVRVDNQWKVTEIDKGNGYVLFEYKSVNDTRPTSGTLELVRGREDEDPVSVLAQLPQMPSYHEQVLLDQLASKMRREYGDPPVRKPHGPHEGPEAGPDGGGGAD
jgi:hypothetical protein